MAIFKPCLRVFSAIALWIHWVPKAPRPEQRPQLRQLQVVPLGFGGLVKAMGLGPQGINH